LRYDEDFILLAKGETVLQGMIDRLINIGASYVMENNSDMKTIPTTVYDRSKKTEVCVIFQPFVLLGKIFTCETACRISVPKAGFNKKKARSACKLG
jgi:ABC-type proline/glycine betaine transport system ATPase subunit